MSDKVTRVEFTNLDKILYPESKITKAQVIEYYIKIAPKMLNFLADRPLTLTRFPNGIDKKGFYEKDAPAGTPPWVKTFKSYSETTQYELNYVVCNNVDTLIWLANLAALEIHATLSTMNSFKNPDLLLFDLDPKFPADFTQVVEVSLLLKDKLQALGLKPYVKTTGKKGLHVIVPIVEGDTYKQTREFVRKTAEHLKEQINFVVTERSKSQTPGRIYVDYAQNSHGKTMVCPYSLRATPRATVSTPLEWSSIEKGLNPEDFNLFSVVNLPANPWEDLFEKKQKLEIGENDGRRGN